jgi:ankyrin repeat protein
MEVKHEYFSYMEDNDIENLIQNHNKSENNLQKLKDLVEYLEDVDYMIYDRYSLLFTTVSYNKFDLVEMLLELGANTEIQNPRGETPLYLACDSNKININMVELLLKYGAEINKIIRFGGDTVLRAAISMESIEKIKLLLDYGADPNLGDDKNNSPLQVVASSRYFDEWEIIKLLLQYGADINSTNVVGVTPLFFACLVQNDINIDILLEYGADPYILNNENQYIMNNPMIHDNIKEYVGNKMYELHKLNVAYDMIEIAKGINEDPLQELTDDVMEEIYNELMMKPYDPEKTRLRMEEDLVDIRIGRFIEDINQYGGKKKYKTFRKH